MTIADETAFATEIELGALDCEREWPKTQECLSFYDRKQSVDTTLFLTAHLDSRAHAPAHVTHSNWLLRIMLLLFYAQLLLLLLLSNGKYTFTQ